MSSGRLFLDRVGRHQSPSPLHRHEQIITRPSEDGSKGDISTLPGTRHFYFALTIEQDKLELAAALFYNPNRFRPAARHCGYKAPASQCALQYRTAGGVVIDHQDRHSTWFEVGTKLASLICQAWFELRGETRSGAAAGLAFDPDAAPHHGHQSAADCKAEASATILSRSAPVTLREGLEHGCLFLLRYSNARVADAEFNQKRAGRGLRRSHRNGQRDLTAFGEFNGIAKKIQQHLAQSPVNFDFNTPAYQAEEIRAGFPNGAQLIIENGTVLQATAPRQSAIPGRGRCASSFPMPQ